MRRWIESVQDVVAEPQPDDVERLVAAGEPFWLDIEDPTEDTIDRLAAAIDLHPLAVDDSKQFGQRGKLARYADVAMIVCFGIEQGEAIEVHAYYTAGFLITLRRDHSSTFDSMHRSGGLREFLDGHPIRLLHFLISELHADFHVAIDEMDDRLDALEARVLEAPSDDQLVEIAGVKQHAASLRRALTPGRDLAVRGVVGHDLPGATEDNMLYLADISEEVQLVVAELAAISERSVELLSLHSSLTSNRQGVAGRQLAAIATIFLPITFIVGFFGMNFGVLIETFEHGWVWFLLLGIGLNVAFLVGTVVWLGRRGWR